MTPFDISQRYVGIQELPGGKNHPLISWWLSLCGFGIDSPDEIAWCSAFMQHAPWELRLPRSKSAAARSWLGIGQAKELGELIIGYDVVILKRGAEPQPDATVLAAPGHVGYFAGWQGTDLLLLGGNQSNKVSIAPFAVDRFLGARRLA